MKKTTRLSAVVLMLALCMNLFVSALATTEGIPIEDLDVSTYQRLMTAAENGEEVVPTEFAVEGNLSTLMISVPDDAFVEGFTVNAVKSSITDEEKAEFALWGGYDFLDVFEVSFADAEGSVIGSAASNVELAFNVDVSNVRGNVLRVYSVNPNGELNLYDSLETIDNDSETIIVKEMNFPTRFVVATEEWTYVGDEAAVVEDILKVAYLDKNQDMILFFNDEGKCYPVSSEVCPDYVVLIEASKANEESNEPLFYTWAPFDPNFYDMYASYNAIYIEPEYITQIVEPAGLYATLTSETDSINLYKSASYDANSKTWDKSNYQNKQFVVKNIADDGNWNWFVEIETSNNSEFSWISYENLANLTTFSDDNVVEVPGENNNTNMTIEIPEGAFGEGVSVTVDAIEAEITEAIIEAVEAFGDYRAFSLFDISFEDITDPGVEIQPESGKTVALTFTVPSNLIKSQSICVFHVKADGTIEIVGDAQPVDRTSKTQTITVQASSFSEYGILEYLPQVGTCEDFDCETYFANCTTPLARYTYVMGDLFDEGNTAETFLLHLAGAHYEETYNFCACTTEMLMYAPGHSGHEADCVWSSANVTCTSEELKAAYDTLDITGRTYFLLAADSAQRQGIRDLLATDEERADFDFYVSGGDGLASWLIDENEANGIKDWVATQTDVAVTPEMVQRAYAVEQKLDEEGAANKALDMLHVEDAELVSVYLGETIADIVEVTDIEGITAKLVDRSMGLTVAYVDADGNLVSVDDVVIPEPETTDEPIEE